MARCIGKQKQGKKTMNRLKEASTWAGISALLPSLQAVAMEPKNQLAWLGVVGGVIAILRREAAAVK
jgi:hypothetical protein